MSKTDGGSQAIVPFGKDRLLQLFRVDDTNEDVLDEINARTMAATTLDEVLADDEGVPGLSNWAGETIVITDVVLRPTTMGRFGYYMKLSGWCETRQERMLASTSSERVMTQITRMRELSDADIRCGVVEQPSKSNPTQSILKLVTAPEPL